jgi:hypothetical protein
MPQELPQRRDDRKARAKILTQAIADTISFLNKDSAPSVTALGRRSGFLISNCYFLLSDAYKKMRGMEDSRTHYYKVAAFTVAAIMTVRPIRVVDTTSVVSIRAALANQQCSMRVAQALLGLDLELVDADFIRRLYTSTFEMIELPSLGTYISRFDSVVAASDDVDFETIERSLPFDAYGIEAFSRPEIATIDNLITQFTTIEKAYGHPFYRILFGWMWPR